MAHDKKVFICSECGYKALKWLGCCPECNEWSTFHEERQSTTSQKTRKARASSAMLVPLDSVTTTEKKRMLSGIDEWDRVVGGGIMPSSLIILTGDPGIGKSTLLLQLSHNLAKEQIVYYFSTEESLQQVKQRARRLNCLQSNMLFSDQAELETIIATALEHKPDIIIIDSIQNCFVNNANTLPGSIGQLRESVFHLMRLAKENEITIILTGHITKDGTIAGPKTLEHMVDAVFYLQGEDRWQSRMLRSVKNRFGPINELGFFEMRSSGLAEVPNINEQLLSEVHYTPGSVLFSVMEGTRPLLLELQALVIETKLAIPQRVISGIDHKQVMLIAAILEKYLHIKLSKHDIFIKISGGFKVKGSGIDLAIALALLSSFFQLPLPKKSIALGEISLTGQIKPINQITMFVKEAEKFGIERILAADNQKIDKTACHVQTFKNVYDLLSLFQEE